jgi:molybdopterin synthase catalytic subunit
VAGRHRGDVFEALPKIMDRIKSEVPIWKKEITETKEYWVHEVE